MTDNLSDKLVIYVGGLDDTVNDKVLFAAFIPFGEIKTIDIPIDFTTQRHKGFGFVEYEEYEDCLHAIENMNDSELCGRVLRVNFAKPQRFKEGTQKPIWMEEDYHKKYGKTVNEIDQNGNINTREKDNKKNEKSFS